MTTERMDEARAYRSAGYRLLLFRMLLLAAFVLGLVLGGARALFDLIGRPVPFLVAVLVLEFLVMLPLRYAGLLVARRHGISVESTGAWLKDLTKELMLTILINGSIGLLVLWLWGAAPQTWHIWAGTVAVGLNLFFSFIGPVWVMPLFHKYTPLGAGELRERLMELSRRAGVAVRGVYVEDSSTKETSLNAALTGLGSTRRIILHDTTMQALSVDEIEVVLAHEMGHHVHNHIARLTAFSTGFILGVFLLAGYALEPLSRFLGLNGLTAPALPLLMMIFGTLGLPLMPALMAASRRWERDCDAFALRMTGKPDAFITAFRKLADRNLADLTPPRWYYYFLSSHPPIPERIQMARRWAM